MAGRNRMPRHPGNFRGYREGPQPTEPRGPRPFPPHPLALEEELEIQHRDIQRFLAKNRHTVDENVMLQRELTAIKDEIRRLEQVIPKLRADGEGQIKELIERGLKLEAELHATEPLRSVVIQLRAEAKKLNALQQELSSQVQTLSKDITRLQNENKQLIAMRTDIDGMCKELVEARRVFEYEKKANEEQVEQKQAMENNLVFMAREIESLRAEQLRTERGARGLGAGGYGMMNGSPEMRYPGSEYGEAYGGGTWSHYDKHGPPRY